MTGHDDHGVSAPQPRKRFPEFDGTGDWVERKIGDFLTESREKGSKGDVAKKLTVKLWGKGVFEKEEALTGSANTQYYRRSAGQFIYSKLDFLNQAFGVIPEALDGFESTIDLPCFDIKPGMNPAFLLEYVQRESFYKKNGEVADGGRKAKRIQPEVFFEMPIILPPKLEEQDAIAEAILSIDALIQAETEKLDALKNHKQGLMQQLFPAAGETAPKVRFSEFENTGNWRFCPLEEILYVRPDYGINASSIPYEEGRPIFLRITDISGNGQFIESGKVSVDAPLSDDSYLREGDIVLARTGASVGKSYAYRQENGRMAHAGYLIRIRPNLEFVDCPYLTHFLNSPDYWTWVAEVSGRGAQPGINSTQICELLVPLPPVSDDRFPLAEQQKIAKTLSSISDAVRAQAEAIEALQLHKLGLLQQLFPVLDEVQG